MADAADRAEADTELYTPFLLAASKRPQGPQPNGKCHWCSENLQDLTQRFCDSYCRDDFEHAEKRKKINGSFGPQE